MTTASATARLDADEERVTRAQRLLIGLGAALVHRPFDTDTHDRLRVFLDNEAAPVLASLLVLQQRGEAQLRRRIAELTGRHIAGAE
ncbi:hypothetical protein P3T36_007287 [Kitasatospora sp. MAP12-15]|uniref:hypothetical protein n=1 Tax=unclassified Kitasatospora TaxID=2633591 RepID=UPI002476452B|nr:hypothetical protein [Kitasatospora sp. MAP12-44]MDH6115670.1 hypothetical protein [Kitasatospora sp. MAP12-44]